MASKIAGRRVRCIMRAMRFLSFLFLFVNALAHGQGTRADYERADVLRERSRGKVLNLKIDAHWSADGKQFWYRRQAVRKEWLEV